MAENHLAAPTALEEHRKLAVFAGEWAGDEVVFPSRWTAGGRPIHSRTVASVRPPVARQSWRSTAPAGQ